MTGLGRFLPLGLALLCVQLDYFALNLALPSIAKDLGSSVPELQWLVSGYLLSLGAMLVPAGRLGDIIGRRATLVLGLAVFAGASLLCGLLPSPTILVAARVVQGVGAALVLPTVYALVAGAADERARPRILGVLLAIAGVGTALGPVVGGVFAGAVGWRWVFLVNVPFAVLALAGAFLVADSRDESVPRRASSADWWGLLAIVSGLAALSLGIDAIPALGIADPAAWLPLAGGVVLLALFVLRESRAALPLVRPSLLRIRDYRRLLIVGLVCNTALNVFVFLATVDLQDIRGLEPVLAGALFIPASLGVAVAGPVGGWLCSRFPPFLVLGFATIGGALGVGVVAFAAELPLYVALLGLGGLACGVAYSVTQIAIQNTVPAARSGEANSLLLMVLIALGGVAVVITSAVVDALGSGVPTAGGIDAVLATVGAGMAVTGVIALVLAARDEHATGGAPRRAARATAPVRDPA